VCTPESGQILDLADIGHGRPALSLAANGERRPRPRPNQTSHPGQVRERIADFQAAWAARFVDLIGQAQSAGEIAADEDPAQLAFELNSMLAMGNSAYVLFADPAALDRARVGVHQRLRLAAPVRSARS
jgi:hypothetical protein